MSGIGELDRVTGGGFVPGSVVLIGGEPGIGKSTLLIQASATLALRGHRVVYISGEEAVAQVRLRAARLALGSAPVELAAALKFLSNADLYWRFGILTRPVFLGLWVVCSLFLVGYLAGVIRMGHDEAPETPEGAIGPDSTAATGHLRADRLHDFAMLVSRVAPSDWSRMLVARAQQVPLTVLRLASCGIGDEGAWVLSNTPLPDGMTILQLPPEYQGITVLTPDAIARAIAFAIEQTPEVDVGEIVIRPTAQG